MTTETELAELEDRWKRALAEADNLRKRFARDVGEAQAAERRRVSALWLPIVDNLELALAHAGRETPTVQGIRAVHDQAIELLAALGFPRDQETGVPFDPQRHEAVAIEPGEPGDEPGTVLLVLRPGYGAGAQQLRPASVVVVAGARDV